MEVSRNWGIYGEWENRGMENSRHGGLNSFQALE